MRNIPFSCSTLYRLPVCSASRARTDLNSSKSCRVGGVVEVRRCREAGEGNRAAYNGSVPICVAVAEEDLQPI